MIDYDRISELYRKSKTEEGLTEAEKEEQKVLRRAYIDSFTGGLRSQLDNIYLVDENGEKTKLPKKDD